MEETIQTKKAFYKRKTFVVPMIALFAIALVSASVAYYHSVQYDFTVSEGRSSSDTLVIAGLSTGETFTNNANIHNSANATLCTQLSWSQTSNPSLVIYTTNLPIKVTNAPLGDVVTAITITADEVSPAGEVVGDLIYTPVAC